MRTIHKCEGLENAQMKKKVMKEFYFLEVSATLEHTNYGYAITEIDRFTKHNHSSTFYVSDEIIQTSAWKYYCKLIFKVKGLLLQERVFSILRQQKYILRGLTIQYVRNGQLI